MTDRFKPLQQCGCGCNQQAHWHRLQLLRDPRNPKRSYLILPQCIAAFERELEATHKLIEVATYCASVYFWQRWRFARIVYALRLIIDSRKKGDARARQSARRAAILMIFPRFIGNFLAMGWMMV